MKKPAAHMPHRWIFVILLLEYGIMGYSGTWFSGLAGNHFFSLGIDPGQWLFYLLGLPRMLLSHPVLAGVIDGCMLAGIFWMVRNPADHRIARILFLLFWCYYATLTACLGHRNFQAGMVFVFIPFLFRKNENRQLAWEATRYFILFFYVSAAFFKFFQGSLLAYGHMSNLLTGQLAPYYVEHAYGIRLSVNQYLVSHPLFAQSLFVGSAMIELLPLIGFFTKKWDRLIIISLIFFHLLNWIIMDIAPVGHISFLCLMLYPFHQKVVVPSNHKLI